MSLFTTLHTGASGLGVSSTYLSVVGDNIANINTVGFKQGRANFADSLPQDAFGLAGGGKVGTGAQVQTVSTIFGQGTLQVTDSATDMAISGNGFFVVSDGQTRYYTRNGTFTMDEQGYLVDGLGNRVQGYGAVDGVLTSDLDDLRLDTAAIAGQATTTVELSAILNAAEDVDDNLSALDFFGTGTGTTTMGDAVDAADFTTSVTVYDSLGVGHDVTVLFERTSDSTWTWRAVTDASEVYDASTGTAYSADEGYVFELASGTVSFDTSGTLSGFSQTNTTGYTFLGSSEPSLSFDFGLDASGEVTNGSLTMTGEESSVSSISQDGYPSGALSDISVASDGSITGSYTNGVQLVLGQVALALFDGLAGLERLGSSLFAATRASGDPSIGVPGTGGRGSVAGYALEQSNVELEAQFVSMITAQRTYQANSRVISTVDETLSNLLQLM